jgi:hypothetical protein
MVPQQRVYVPPSDHCSLLIHFKLTSPSEGTPAPEDAALSRGEKKCKNIRDIKFREDVKPRIVSKWNKFAKAIIIAWCGSWWLSFKPETRTTEPLTRRELLRMHIFPIMPVTFESLDTTVKDELEALVSLVFHIHPQKI